MKNPKLWMLLPFAIAASGTLLGDVNLPNLFSDNMVIQRDAPVKVWGTAAPNEKVSVKFGSAEAYAVADASGNWEVGLPAMKESSSPQEMTVSGKNSITISNILVGDVWICSGQSNMWWKLNQCLGAQKDIASANIPGIRRILMDNVISATPSFKTPRKWEDCTRKTAPSFSGAAFYFARKLHAETSIPHRGN